MSTPFDAVVVGGGFAGIACAVHLARGGRRVALVERRPTLGGRVHSHRDQRTGDMLDNGPHLMVGGYHSTKRLLDLLGTARHVLFQPRLELAMRDECGEILFRRRSLPGALGLAAGLVRMRGITARDVWRTRRLLPAARMADPAALDAITCDEWFDRLGVPTPVRRVFLDPICTAALNDRPARASAALFANVLRRTFSGHGADGLGFVLGPHTLLFDGAVQPLVRAGGGEIITGRRAVQVLFDGETPVGVALADGREVRARHVVVAVPPRQVASLFAVSQRGSLDLGLLEALGAAPIINTHLWLDRPVVDRPLVGLLDCLTQFVYGVDLIWSERARHHRVVGIISGPLDAAAKSNQDLIDQTLEDLRARFPAARGAQLVHAVVVREREATFLPRPGLLSRRPGARSPWRTLWWAGDWTATGFPSTIEGAVQSGHRAAQAVLGAELP